VQRSSGLTELKRKHDLFSEPFRVRGPAFTDTKNFFVLEQRKYDEQVNHQVKQKLLRFDPIKDEYRVTVKWALRTQRYMFNPFADKLSPLKVAAALVVAIFPVIASLQQSQLVSFLQSTSMSGILSLVSIPTISYMISGVAAGLLFEHKASSGRFCWPIFPPFSSACCQSYDRREPPDGGGCRRYIPRAWSLETNRLNIKFACPGGWGRVAEPSSRF